MKSTGIGRGLGVKVGVAMGVKLAVSGEGVVCSTIELELTIELPKKPSKSSRGITMKTGRTKWYFMFPGISTLNIFYDKF